MEKPKSNLQPRLSQTVTFVSKYTIQTFYQNNTYLLISLKCASNIRGTFQSNCGYIIRKAEI